MIEKFGLLVTALLLGCFFEVDSRAGPLHEAAVAGDDVALTVLLEGGASVQASDEAGLTPLIIAARAGHSKTVALLVSRGADPRGRDEKGLTALHAASHSGQLGVVTVLLEQGVDVNDQKNRFGLTPLHAAAEANYLEIAQRLLDAGARTGRPDSSGWSPVMRATFREHPDMVKLLRDHGAKCTGRADMFGIIPAGLKPFISYCMNGGA